MDVNISGDRQLKTYKISEKELDERLALDKRCNPRAFYRYFEPEEELPAGFYDLQDKIRDGLEKEFWTHYDDGVDRSNLPSWEQPMNTWFYFPAELMNCELVKLEMSNEILGDRLIGLIMAYLDKCPSRYGVNVAVYRGMQTGSNYLGRFVINLDEIVVEESLVKMWSEQVKLMEIEA
jgi:hypothetical protein